ncbi:hypothetical protein GKG47_09275 [Lactonifactor sp. BIOML-A3]|uniref:hypothetical protein n=1 Tax=unclassified Lactonifactor TaxID=2636670 RepID=UPI0012AF9B50|nr:MULTISPECIES: hypothetical protein [unclassified Lactonifactor]MSA02228.1 hypothetical protein [Lactonifactor sp. BIOML-A5]MSA08012.1 hypothetical protein [Lactonifactor sp. BIOML-A4]MSA12628.1 hypothetical protein [Lactonifactor sp. BIOML-A3]MSA16670.1 hypothetical protein [Lactonifactor sp. BIOML-A2]MSA37631.1 hypothetical protein [Lactonifactor sp. BIOML-A1]
MVETSNGRNCRDCSKSNVCKYQETVVEEVEKLISQVDELKLPLSININCREFSGRESTIRGMEGELIGRKI